MAFEAETGSGSATANSLAAVAEADTYHSDRGNTAWAGFSTGTKQSLLIKATDYLQNQAMFPWRGQIKTATQALCWPRTGVVEQYGLAVSDLSVPLKVRQATAILALAANTTNLLPVVQPPASGVKRQKIDVLETEYFEGGTTGGTDSATLVPQVTEALGLVRTLLRVQEAMALSEPYANLPPREENTQVNRPLFYPGQHDNLS